MTGVKGRSGRPGGNPDIKAYGFKVKGEDPLNVQVGVRISEQQKRKLDGVENWRDVFRDWIDSLPDPEPENQN
ncbi:hypothetical protein NG798_00600 [Ancylothrix sp. C2]|uniref:hypothetical protein n=1 Tax=Ancylothrix sp. D3o TaxID=2953691 RepID=UPI0021BBA114|nr:hypothetical protein [Ancylothrix sp. D3o]MCT7948292.1 hypothetical protein [Ancylothrix sp. D3o]